MDAKDALELEVELERETYEAGTDPLCRGVVRFRVPPDSPLLQSRVRTHICAVLDISGSMDEPDKYPMLLEALRLLCAGLVEGQHLTVIAFSSDAQRIAAALDHRTAAAEGEQIIERIDRCWFRFGGTTLGPALKIALDELQRGKARWPDVVQRLYVLTDGQLDDAVDCLRFTHYLEQLGIEFGSYGFGVDFALETMRAIIGDCLGGGVKRIPDAATLKETFRHLARLGQRVVLPSAELELAFTDGVIAGDAFWHRPIPRWLRRGEEDSLVVVPAGALEARREYVLAFEARVVASTLDTLGTVTLRCSGDSALDIARSIPVRFVSEEEQGSLRPAVRAILDDVAALRDEDADTLLRAYRARLEIFRREYRDAESIWTLQRAIETLERTGSLEELADEERREIEADHNTVMPIKFEDRSQDADVLDPSWGEPDKTEPN